jgi:hypothetical protein
MNTFIVVCSVFCVMLLIFIAYAFIINKDTTPVSAQKKRLLSSTVNNITNESDLGTNAPETNSSESI